MTEAPREQMNVVIVGHVDHGKSTVVGRLLADTGALPQGQAGGGAARVPAHGQAVRVRLPARRAVRRAGPGHHHRHRALLLQDRAARLHHHRRPRAHRVPQEHDLRRGPRRGRRAGHRRQGGRAREQPPPRLHPVDARHPAGRRLREQDGSRRLRRADVPGHRGGVPGVPRRDRRGQPARVRPGQPRSRARTWRSAATQTALVRRPDAARGPGHLRRRRRPRSISRCACRCRRSTSSPSTATTAASSPAGSRRGG